MVAAMAGMSQLAAQETPQIASVQYWIDNAHTTATVGSSLEFDVDCSALPPGVHTLHYRIADTEGRYSPLQEHSFLKLSAPGDPAELTSLQYWWDDLSQNAVTVLYTSEQFTLSANALPFGLHGLHYRVQDSKGRWSPIMTHYVYRGDIKEPAKIVSYSYWWNDLSDNVTTTIIDEPTVSFTIDEDLTVPEEARTGFAGHYTARLNVVMTDSNGRSIFLTSDVAYPDNDAPVTDIDADSYVASSTVKLTWVEKSDDKMGDYNVYVSKDGGPFMLWLPDTTQTSATFRGERGSAYLFTVIGRDAFGNREKYDETKNVSVTFE